MSVSNEPETISLYDMVDDESKINEDQNDFDLSLNDSNQPFACNRHLELCLKMVFDKLEDAKACYNAYARWKEFGIRVNHTWKTKNYRILVGIKYVCSKKGFRRRHDEDTERKGPECAKTRVECKAMIDLKKIEDSWVVFWIMTGFISSDVLSIRNFYCKLGQVLLSIRNSAFKKKKLGVYVIFFW